MIPKGTRVYYGDGLWYEATSASQDGLVEVVWSDNELSVCTEESFLEFEMPGMRIVYPKQMIINEFYNDH